MRILVTGATGQIGGALVPLLAPYATILRPGRAQLDLAKPRLIAAVLDQLAPDLVVSAAAFTGVDTAEDEPALAQLVNAEAPVAIAQWGAARQVPLIHFSTDYVFDGSGDRPWREDSSARPLSVYGATKLAGDLGIRAIGVPHLLVRTSWVYASRGTNFLGSIAGLARERKRLLVVADQVGAPTPASVVARAVSRIILENSTNLSRRFEESGGIVNVATSGEISRHGFATRIVNGLRERGVALQVEEVVPILSAQYPMRAERPKNSRLDLTRLKRVFGIATPSWHEALDVELAQFIDEIG